ncbi:MAG: hypothetical protein R3B90_08445 [Planctomycetaceae bacterium]
MVAKPENYKRLGFDGLEGGSPDIKDIALKEAIAETGFQCMASSMECTGIKGCHRLDETVRESGRVGA